MKHGKWILQDDRKYAKCSECESIRNIETQLGWNFCPACGAKMDGKEVVKKDYNPCNKCTHKGWNMPQCQYCNKANGYKYMELDIEKFMESKNVPDRKDGE